MNAKLKESNVEFDNKAFDKKVAADAENKAAGGLPSTLIEQYKAKLSKA
jgi:hypothetical protein